MGAWLSCMLFSSGNFIESSLLTWEIFKLNVPVSYGDFSLFSSSAISSAYFLCSSYISWELVMLKELSLEHESILWMRTIMTSGKGAILEAGLMELNDRSWGLSSSSLEASILELLLELLDLGEAQRRKLLDSHSRLLRMVQSSTRAERFRVTNSSRNFSLLYSLDDRALQATFALWD